MRGSIRPAACLVLARNSPVNRALKPDRTAADAREGETHYFFESGAGCTIAFFEYAGFEPGFSAKPAGVPHPSASQFDHLALGLADDWVRRP